MSTGPSALGHLGTYSHPMLLGADGQRCALGVVLG